MEDGEEKKKYSISAFFPMYNDDGTVELMVKKLKETLPKFTDDWEIIMVDDCSPDKSGEIADQLAKDDSRLKVVHHEKNKGYGGALKSGFKTATKDLIFYTDGDAQYDIYELERLMPHINEYDVVNGYKTNRADGIHRKIVGEIYNFGMHLAFNLKVKDVDCDFRLMHKKIFNQIELESDSGMICVEMMKKIGDAGLTIKDVPVNHYDRQHGKSQFFNPKRVIKTLAGLVKLWINIVLLRKGGKKKK
jgi:glycosyltransferase involved in cell wall biosynthesis